MRNLRLNLIYLSFFVQYMMDRNSSVLDSERVPAVTSQLVGAFDPESFFSHISSSTEYILAVSD